MKLYMFPVAPNPTKVRLYLAEKKHAGCELPVEEVVVDLREGEQRSPEHLSRNPFGRLPVLELDDGTCLIESLPMISYLEELHPEPPLIGATALERAQTLTIERIADTGVLLPIARIVHATDSPLGLPPNPELAAAFRESLVRPCEVLNDRLSDGRPFLMGDHVTVADCTLAAGLQMGRFKNVEPDPTLDHLARWNATYRQRDAAREVLLV